MLQSRLHASLAPAFGMTAACGAVAYGYDEGFEEKLDLQFIYFI